MKIVFMVLALSAASFTSAHAQTVTCSGTYEGKSGAENLFSVTANLENMDLAYSITPAALPQAAIPIHLNITRVLPMFPIYSVQAEKDFEPVDGTNIQLTIAISSEIMSPGQKQDGQITIEQTSLRGGKSAERFHVPCTINK